MGARDPRACCPSGSQHTQEGPPLCRRRTLSHHPDDGRLAASMGRHPRHGLFAVPVAVARPDQPYAGGLCGGGHFGRPSVPVADTPAGGVRGSRASAGTTCALPPNVVAGFRQHGSRRHHRLGGSNRGAGHHIDARLRAKGGRPGSYAPHQVSRRVLRGTGSCGQGESGDDPRRGSRRDPGARSAPRASARLHAAPDGAASVHVPLPRLAGICGWRRSGDRGSASGGLHHGSRSRRSARRRGSLRGYAAAGRSVARVCGWATGAPGRPHRVAKLGGSR